MKKLEDLHKDIMIALIFMIILIVTVIIIALTFGEKPETEMPILLSMAKRLEVIEVKLDAIAKDKTEKAKAVDIVRQYRKILKQLGILAEMEKRLSHAKNKD